MKRRKIYLITSSLLVLAACGDGDETTETTEAEEPAVEHARELVEARGILRDRGLEAGLIEPAGDPAETIERLAAERGYDTIVVGGNRCGRDGHPWMESVTAHVAANAKADVVVARRALAPFGKPSDRPEPGS